VTRTSLLHIAGLALGLLFEGTVVNTATAQESTLDRQAIVNAASAIAKVVSDEYFDPQAGARAATHLREYAVQTRETFATPDGLASAPTRELYASTRDKHLAVSVSRGDPSPAAPSPAETRARRAARENFWFRDVGILDDNVGYLDIRTFYRLNEARDTLDAALRFVAHADALIIDLRNNQGGSPETVALLAGYLFDQPGKPLFDIVPRSGPAVHYATPSPAVDSRNGARPTYVLTSARTFSAGEGLAFILQDERRAVVVGEQTAGAANPGRPYPAGHGFEVTVPNGQVRSAASGRNWEGAGVTPDIPVPADRAQATALDLARRVLTTQRSAR
jgi:hypothetical protein